MLFNSYAFLFVFLPLVLAGFFLIRRQGARLVFLIVASYVFYAYDEWWFPALMAASTTISFCAGLLIARTEDGRRRTWTLGLGIAGVLSMLLFFKYAQLASGSVVSIVETLTATGLPSVEDFTSGIILPIGISFFTFEAISYMVDVFRRDTEAERNPLRYALFISFFPHLIAGPIVRYDKLRPQLDVFYRLDSERFFSGLMLLSVGLIEKVVLADGIAARTDPLFASPGELGFLGSWSAMFAYSFQIYFDFAGYCDMALGLARLFGIELPWNFNRPYRARNPREFWQRWHVTLSSWLRDYLYIPLGGNRKGDRRQDVNVMATMGLGGLWHGASFSFLIWGLYQGLLLVGYRHLSKRGLHVPVVAATALTFVLVTVGWVFFRLGEPGEVADLLGGMIGLDGIGSVPTGLVPYVLVCGTLMWGVSEAWSWDFWRFPGWRLVPLGLATGLALVLTNSAERFIYFRF